MRRPQPDNVSRSQVPGPRHSGPLEPHSLLFNTAQSGPEGDPRSLHRGALASNGPGFVTGKPPFGHSVAHPASVSILSTRHGVPRILEDSPSTSSSHPPGASLTQSRAIIIECFLIIETRTFQSYNTPIQRHHSGPQSRVTPVAPSSIARMCVQQVCPVDRPHQQANPRRPPGTQTP